MKDQRSSLKKKKKKFLAGMIYCRQLVSFYCCYFFPSRRIQVECHFCSSSERSTVVFDDSPSVPVDEVNHDLSITRPSVVFNDVIGSKN